MNVLTTWTRRGSLVPVLAVAAAALLAGCHGSGVVAGGAATTPAAVTAPASGASSAPVSAPVSSSASVPVAGPSSAPASAPASAPPTAAARVVYLVGGGSVTGTRWHEPGCSADCVLSGDGTMALHAMTWQSWGATQATGTGTVQLLNCSPNCAGGRQYPVPATVTLSRPVLICAGGAGHWYWTRVSFTWTKGLPAVFSGDNAPANPFNYAGLASQAATSC